MTEREWIDIGYEKGIIDMEKITELKFWQVYAEWFNMKKNLIKPQSLDRIEVTYNRWYIKDSIIQRNVADITDNDIIEFLNQCIVKSGKISYKEFGRIWQIVNNVMVYARDKRLRGVCLHDWDHIKRSCYAGRFESNNAKYQAVSEDHVRKFMQEVNTEIYPFHQCCGYMLCMNFYLGLRVGELAALRFTDFDLDKHVLRITRTESKFYERDENGHKRAGMTYRIVDSTKTIYSVREIPLLPQAEEYLGKIKNLHRIRGYDSEYLAYDGEEVVFVRALDRTLRMLCRKCKIPYFSSHMIRKTFATKLHHANVPTRVISDLLGHSDISTTERNYIKSYQDEWKINHDYMQLGLRY